MAMGIADRALLGIDFRGPLAAEESWRDPPRPSFECSRQASLAFFQWGLNPTLSSPVSHWSNTLPKVLAFSTASVRPLVVADSARNLRADCNA